MSSSTAEIQVEGMTCANCVGRIERALKKTQGVEEARVNLVTGQASVKFKSEIVQLPALYQSIEKAGYKASAPGLDPKVAMQKEYLALKEDFQIALFFSLPLLVIAMLPMLHPSFMAWQMHLQPSMAFWQFLQLALATPVLFWPGKRFFRSGWRAYVDLSPNMNSLVMTGTGAAYGYSLLVTLLPQLFPIEARHVYYEAAAVVITLILLGKMLEAKSKGRSQAAIQKLLELQAKTAHVIRNGIESDIAIENLQIGDTIAVKPGEKIPTDGIILSGEIYVDESMISGEVKAVSKTIGASVIGATQNQNGYFTFRVERLGKHTVLSQIIRMVEEAQLSKPPIQDKVDKVVMVFTPIVLAIAILTFIAWFMFGPKPSIIPALVHTVAVLVIACPCAMGLATPTAILVGTGKAAELGLVIRNGMALQNLSEVDTLALDKTGTLTQGHPIVTSILPVTGWNRSALLTLAAGLEKHSEHPLARAILQAAQKENISLPEVNAFIAIPGKGVQGEIHNQKVLLGSPSWIQTQTDKASIFEEEMRSLMQQNQSVFCLAVDGKMVGLFSIADALKEGSVEAIKTFKQMGLETWMLTGDQEATAKAIAQQVGIAHFRAQILPQDKANILAEFHQQGKKVAFAGDGINDAPALVKAHVGIAMGKGSDLAIESGDIILMSDDLRTLAKGIRLAKQVMRTLKMNLFWAFAYNVLLIPVAAGAFAPWLNWQLNPMLAAAAMGLSSVFVLTNSLRLKRIRL